MREPESGLLRIRIGSGFKQISGSGSGFRTGSGSRSGKMTHKNRKKLRLKCWFFIWKYIIFPTVNFCEFLVIKTLDSDPLRNRFWIRIGIQLKWLIRIRIQWIRIHITGLCRNFSSARKLGIDNIGWGKVVLIDWAVIPGQHGRDGRLEGRGTCPFQM